MCHSNVSLRICCCNGRLVVVATLLCPPIQAGVFVRGGQVRSAPLSVYFDGIATYVAVPRLRLLDYVGTVLGWALLYYG